MAQYNKSTSLHLGHLDGLRFFAFLAVFIHHLPNSGLPVLTQIHSLGWMGVDLFFVISSFLFFYLFKAETAKTGSINVGQFYLRRILRLYPLMMLAPVLAVLVSPIPIIDPAKAFGRYLALGLFSDNLLSAIQGYNATVPWVSHLWTLSLEFQVYLVMPFVFLVFQAVGAKRLLWGLVGVAAFAIAARLAFILCGVSATTVWVTPFLRPESILIGLALAVGGASLIPGSVPFAAGAIALVTLVLGPDATQGGPWLLVSYPLVAVFCGALVWLTLNLRALQTMLGWAPLAYLGKISFGLYVFHLAAIYFANDWLGGDFRIAPGGYWGLFSISLVLCVGVSALSYRLLERPFLKLKDRFSAVISRPI
jgi:peptidoglycan/LPS O-acetylase OafA/YrhL